MLTNDAFAALSAVLTYMFFIGSSGLAVLTWRLRARFRFWNEMGPQGRADTILNIGLCGVLAIAGFHRALATYNFALNRWSPTGFTAGVYLPLHIAAMAAVLWWLCAELVGATNGWLAWLTLMGGAALLGGTIIIVF